MLERGLDLPELAQWFGLDSGKGVNGLKNRMPAVARCVSSRVKRRGECEISGV